MSIAVGHVKLRDSYKQLKFAYERVKEHWDDDARRDFESMYLAGLESKILTAISGISRMQDVFTQARRDCE